MPDRGRQMEMPPKEPLVYRLYEIVQNYGYAYKAVMNEKFGDGIMSAISFSTKVEKEVDEKGEFLSTTKCQTRYADFVYHRRVVQDYAEGQMVRISARGFAAKQAEKLTLSQASVHSILDLCHLMCFASKFAPAPANSP